MINVGGIVLRLGTGETPTAETTPTVCFDEEQLYGEDEYPVSAQVINARRAVAEVTRLAQLAIEEVKTAPTIALADGNIALRVQQEAHPGGRRQRTAKNVHRAARRVEAGQVPIAAFVSRPGTTAIIKLMQLATYSLDEVEARVTDYTGRPFGGLIDAAVFATLLAPGQRSAVFELATLWGKPYREAGHAIHFFYLNVGTPIRSAIARVEVPEWVANNAAWLGWVHSAIVDQCHITDIAYPYALARADELAVITTAEKTNFEQMIGVEMLRHGVEPSPSEKAAAKAICALREAEIEE